MTGPDGDLALAQLHGERLTVPELADLEVASVLRQQMKAGTLDARRLRLALDDLAALSARRAPRRSLLPPLLGATGQPHHLRRRLRSAR